MFCSNCGKEVSGNFCSNCGYKVANNVETVDDSKKDIIILNGIEVDMGYVYSTYKNKIEAIKYLTDTTKIKLKEAKETVDNYYSKLENERNNIIKDKIRSNRENGIVCCPKCGSTSLSAQKKGFGIGKAVVGAAAIGALGLTAGNINSSKIKITCLNCGYKFKPGQ